MFAKLITAGSTLFGELQRCVPYGYTPVALCTTGINPSWGLCGDGLMS